MPLEYKCALHGYYDASEGSCPHCRKEGRYPEEAKPLGQQANRDQAYDDDGDTDPNYAARGAYRASDDQTVPPSGGRNEPDDQAQDTQPPKNRRDGDGEVEPEDTWVDQEDTTVIGWLIVKNSEVMQRGQLLKLRGKKNFGRDSKNDYVLREKYVSGLHAQVEVRNNQFFIVDFNSENGTFVGDERINGKTEIKENDIIRIGRTTFVLKTLL
jgi:hypothetical protein